MMQSTTSDGTNRIFLASGPGAILPILSQGDPAPGIPNKKIGFMFASGNDRGAVAILTKLDDGDSNFFNDQSAIFAGTATNLALVALSPAGIIWGGGTFMTRSNLVVGPGRNAFGFYQLPDFPGGSVSFTPFPPLPYPALPGTTGLGSSVNSLGQYAVLYGNAGLNRGLDLWLFNPGDGWTNVARAGSNLVASGQTILVNSLGFAGNLPFGSGTGGGIATGLSDDGVLMFSVNGAHIVSAQLACTKPGIELIALEVNQAVQDWKNSVPLVEGKETYVRAFVQPENCPGNTASVLVSGARLHGFRAGVELPASPLGPINPGGAVLAQTNAVDRRDQLYESLVFVLPPSWTSNSITLQFDWPGGFVTYSDPAEPGGSPADGTVQVSFQPSSLPSVKWVGVTYTDVDGITQIRPNIADADELGRRLVSIYPINGHDLLYGELMWPYAAPPATFDDLALINLALLKMRLLDLGNTNRPNSPLSFSTLYYGFLRGGAGIGLAEDTPGNAATGWMRLHDFDFGRELHAHELAHLLGREHAVDGALGLDLLNRKQGYCSEVASNTAPDFPNFYDLPTGRRPTLGPMGQGPNSMIWGLDSYSLFKQDPLFGQVVNPTNSFELMSYCNSVNFPVDWISAYTYTNLFAVLAQRFPGKHSLLPPGGFANTRALQAAQNAGAADYLLISGAIDVVQNSATLAAVLRAQLTVPPPEIPGAYTLRLSDAGGGRLTDISFNPHLGQPDAPGNGPHTTAIYVIPVPANPAIRQIEILHGAQVLASRKASANAPTIKLLSPNGGEVLTDDPVTIRWDAQDADGDALTYLVQFSGDGGQSWQTLTLDWPNTSYTISLEALKATQQGRIRIQASDGFNTSEDDSDANFTVPNHPPKISAVSPSENELIVGNQQFVLRANITDREDGSVPDERVSWTSRTDGPLGSGNQLFLKASALSEGDHIITVSVSDGNGAAATKTFPIKILREATPQLQIEVIGERIHMAWPAALLGYVLESSPNLRSESWTTAPLATSFLRGMKVVEVPTTEAPRFFRLRKL